MGDVSFLSDHFKGSIALSAYINANVFAALTLTKLLLSEINEFSRVLNNFSVFNSSLDK